MLESSLYEHIISRILLKKTTIYAVLAYQSPDAFTSDALLKQLEVDAPDDDLQVNMIVGSN